jgi:hypothetical protein
MRLLQLNVANARQFGATGAPVPPNGRPCNTGAGPGRQARVCREGGRATGSAGANRATPLERCTKAVTSGTAMAKWHRRDRTKGRAGATAQDRTGA